MSREVGQLFDNLKDKKEIAHHLGVSISFIDKEMRKGLPHYKVGRLVRFKVTEVEDWLKRRKRAS